MQKRELHTPTLSSNFNLKEEIENYISHWKWFVVGVFVCFTVAYLYLRYTIPQKQSP